MKRIMVAVDGIILNSENNKVLLVKRNNDSFEGGKWSIPGGTMEFGETLLECLKRELHEELNVDVENEKIFGTFEYITEDLHGVGIYYTCNLKTDNIVIQEEELSEYKWFSLDEAKDLDLAFNQSSVLENYKF